MKAKAFWAIVHWVRATWRLIPLVGPVSAAKLAWYAAWREPREKE